MFSDAVMGLGKTARHRLQGQRLPKPEQPAKSAAMDVQTTGILLAAGLALGVVGALGGALRTRAPLAWHAHLPWNGITFVGVAGMLVAAVHLFTLIRQP